MQSLRWISLVWLVGCFSPISAGEHVVNVDYDQDGYVVGTDCDDHHSAVHPGADEVCNGRDDDCDGSIDGPEALGAATWYADEDGDGHGDPDKAVVGCGPRRHSPYGDDCDDSNIAVRGGCGL